MFVPNRRIKVFMALLPPFGELVGLVNLLYKLEAAPFFLIVVAAMPR
jgi:hypothetical protein